jgi:hypothetical protein
MKRVVCFLAIGIAAVAGWRTLAQEREDRTLLAWDQLRAIINEASGDRALHTVQEMVPYERIHTKAEYEGNFRESDVMARLAREYGFSNVEIEKFPQGGPGGGPGGGGGLWQATVGELWMTAPTLVKLYDLHDIAVSLCSGSPTGDVTADLVDVGSGGRAEDYAGKDVKGKIVLGAAGAGTIARFATGALGVISYNPIHPEADIDEIGSQSIGGGMFGWSVSPRSGRALAAAAARGKVTLRSIVKADSYPSRMETVHAEIPGDGSTDQAVALSGHLYEGYIKQGANDDASGCAVTLEMGRTLLKLVAEGKLPKPKRTIHFLWVPEISGTTAWLNKHQDVAKKLIADLNFDMEGLGLAENRSMWVMHRTPDTFPTFLNDIGQSVMETIAELNRERVRYRSGGYGFTLPVLSPAGSQDPFYIKVDKFYGASDHVVYMGQGIPSLMFITWPDPYYHSSKDLPEKLDPTQFKRVAVVGLASLMVVDNADDIGASRVAGESFARGAERMGDAQRKGLGYMADVADGAALADAYSEAKVAIRHQADVEKGVMRSLSVLFTNPAEAQKRLATFETLIDQRATVLQNEATAYYKLQAEHRKVAATEPAPNAMEQRAARLVVERVGGAGGGRGAGGGGGRGGANVPMTPERQALMAAQRKIPSHMTSELNGLIAQKKTVLEIRDFISGEFEPVPLADVMEYFEAQATVGAVKFTEKPVETKKPVKK